MQDQRGTRFPAKFRDLFAEHGISGKRWILKPNQSAGGHCLSHSTPERLSDFFGDGLWSLFLIGKVVTGWFVDKIDWYSERSNLRAFAFSSAAEHGDFSER